ncbi:MAG: ATP-binding protein [Candidatus Margulisbacteria bacterium]|jgi:two-component system phosphate regulon sensor histidine kinase PhoR|nr:ATP-binding protein [Candidatus Margulisiibacteriota bacterium]
MFEQALNGMKDGVLMVDSTETIIFANRALSAILSLSQAELIGKRPLEAIRLIELAELIAEVRSTGSAASREMKVVYPQEKTLLGSANLIKTDNGPGVAVIVQDISEIKKLENLRQEFVANVSHELKTPLTAIKSYAETLIHGAIDDPINNRPFLEKIEKNAKSLAALIDDTLEISRLESRRGVAPFAPVHLSDEIEQALETLAPRIKEKELEIIKAGEPESCTVSGEAEHIYRALLNLLDNAVKYSPAGGRIELACAQTDRELRLSVKDHGPGIPAEHQPRLFERFYRVDKARSRELGGTGLGLSIVKHIMEIHGGRVELKSTAGQGAEFTLIFPR